MATISPVSTTLARLTTPNVPSPRTRRTLYFSSIGIMRAKGGDAVLFIDYHGYTTPISLNLSTRALTILLNFVNFNLGYLAVAFPSAGSQEAGIVAAIINVLTLHQ